MSQKKSELENLLIKQKLRLDVGCGFRKQPGFTGIDKRKVKGVDIVHDIEIFPWPVPDDCCEMIMMSHLVEHIKPWFQIDLLDECWRIMREDGVLLIATPYATSFGYYQDPTHCSPWNEATPTYFIKGQPLYEVYKPKPWKADIAPNGFPNIRWDKHGTLEIALRKILE